MYWLDKLQEQEKIKKCAHFFGLDDIHCQKCGYHRNGIIRLMNKFPMNTGSDRLEKFKKKQTEVDKKISKSYKKMVD